MIIQSLLREIVILGFFLACLKGINLSIYDNGQCLGKNLTNAKEMPILKNSKENSKLKLSKTSFSVRFLIQQNGSLVNMYYWNINMLIRANILIAISYSRS